MAKSRQTKITSLLTETIRVLCQQTLDDSAGMTIQGLLGITLKNEEIILVHVNEVLGSSDVDVNRQPKSVQKLTGIESRHMVNCVIMENSKSNRDLKKINEQACGSRSSEWHSMKKSRYLHPSISGTKGIELCKSDMSVLTSLKTIKHRGLGANNRIKGVGRSRLGKGKRNITVIRDDVNETHNEIRSTKYNSGDAAKNLSVKNQQSEVAVLQPTKKIYAGKRKRSFKGSTSKKLKPNCKSDVFKLDTTSTERNKQTSSNALEDEEHHECTVCKKHFRSLTRLASHYTAFHSNSISVTRDSTSVSNFNQSVSQRSIKCIDISCERMFETNRAMRRHFTATHDVSRGCKKPCYQRKFKKDLSLHHSKLNISGDAFSSSSVARIPFVADEGDISRELVSDDVLSNEACLGNNSHDVFSDNLEKEVFLPGLVVPRESSLAVFPIKEET